MRRWIKFSVIGILIFLAAGVIAFQITSSNFAGRNKFDFGGAQTASNSASFIQRFIFGNQPVSQYSSSSYSGRFGVLDDTESNVSTSICGNLNIRNAVYVLNQSVNSSGTCFTIVNENVTLDCSGFTINYTQATAGYAVTSNGYNYSIIKNCKIIQGRTNATSSYGIYLRNGYNSTVQNNNLTLSGATGTNANNYGIYLNSQMRSIIYNNNITTTGRQNYGVYLYGQSNSTNLTNNKISTSAVNTYALASANSYSNIIRNNNLTTTGISAYAVYLRDSGINNLTSNNASTSGTSAHAIYVQSFNSASNIFDSNKITIRGASSRAIYLYGMASNTNIIYNNITSLASGSYGIYAYGNVNNSIINYNNINVYGTGSTAIVISLISNYNNLTNNIIYTNNTGSYGISVTTSSGTAAIGNLIANNTVDSLVYPLSLTRANLTKVYNNIFNSTSRTIVSTTNDAAYVNKLNTTKTDLTPNKNIILGSFLAGNFWANSFGTGFSQTCKDNNVDGICDSNYTINSYNIDYLALTKTDNVAPVVFIWTPENDSFVNGRVSLIANASDNFVIANVVFQYSNSSVAWTNLASCNLTASNYRGDYRCYWQTSTFSNGTEGYNIKAVAYDGQGNTAEDIKHYTIDRTRPIIYEMSVVYPGTQSSVRDGQNITLEAVVTDSPEISAGIDYVQANLTSLNSTSWTNLILVSGSKASDMNSTWNLNVNVDSTTGIQRPNIRVYDAATPTPNTRTGVRWSVRVDNDAPTYSGLSSSTGIYNNTVATFTVTANDNYDLDHYILSQNWSGAWVNDSSVSISGVSEYIEYNKAVYSGNFSYKFFIFDDAGNMAETTAGNIEVYGAAPTPIIYLSSPSDDSLTKNNSVDFKFYYLNSDVDNCTLVLDEIKNETLLNPLNETILSFTTKTLVDGEHSWYVSCDVMEMVGEDTVSNSYISEDTYNVNIDTIAPLITIVSPLNSTYSTSSIGFNISINDDSDWCGYSLNNALNVTMIKENSTYFYYSKTGMTIGGYKIDFSCNDTANNFNFSTQHFSIIFPAISINLTSPLNNADIVRGHDATGGVSNEDDLGLVSDNFNLIAKIYNDSDGGIDGATCYFYFNDTNVGSNYTNSSGDCVYSYDKSSYATNIYNLSVNYTYIVNDVTRDVNNSGANISLVRYLTPNSVGGKGVATQYTDNQTAIFYFNITKINSTGTFFYDPQNITVNATNSVNTPYPETAYVSGYRIYKNAQGQYETRVVVNLTFGTYIRWKVYISDNNWTSYLGTALHSDVEIVNTPICGNSRIEGTEACDDGNLAAGDGCSVHCTSEGSSGGGGSGGETEPCISYCTSGAEEKTCVTSGTLRTKICGNYDADACAEWGGESYSDCDTGKVCEDAECSEKCAENFVCGAWEDCLKGIQKRTCVDGNLCTTKIKEETNLCGDWDCGEWKECKVKYDVEEVIAGEIMASGYQQRECSDQDGRKKLDERNCSLSIPISARLTEWCDDIYVEIFEASTDKLVSRVKEKEIVNFSDLKRVDISFITSEFTGYCDYCFDGIKDYDETGLDCGGPNCSECVPKFSFFDWLYWVILISWSIFGLFLFILFWKRRKEEEKKTKIKKSLSEKIKSWFAKIKSTDRKERIAEEKMESFFKRLFGKKTIKEKIERAEPEIKIKRVVSQEERMLFQLKAKLKKWKEEDYAGTSALESKIVELENKIARKEKSFVKRIVSSYRRKREEKRLEKIKLRRQEEIESTRREREKSVDKIRKQREWNHKKAELVGEKKKFTSFFKNLFVFKKKKIEEHKQIRIKKSWFAGFFSKLKKKREARKEEKNIIKIRKQIKKEAEKPKRSLLKKIIYNYKERREKKKRESKEIKIIKKEIERPKKSLFRKAVESYKIRREKKKERKKYKKIQKEFIKKVKKKEKEVRKKIKSERKVKRKKRKNEIRTLKREVRKRKLIGLMRKLNLWKKEGYYGTAHLEEEIRRLKSQKD